MYQVHKKILALTLYVSKGIINLTAKIQKLWFVGDWVDWLVGTNKLIRLTTGIGSISVDSFSVH